MDSTKAAGTQLIYPSVELHPGQHLHGFEVKAVTPIAEWRAVGVELGHQQSGARVFHLCTDDAENLFSINLPTPTPDNTGVQHILEHCVLAGSSKFSVKELFFEMLKTSMATNLSAINWFDHVYYFGSSYVKRDLFNLSEIYFDSVFHPLLTDETFRREGYHLAPVDPDSPTSELTINGIVYNEVKRLSPDDRLFLNAVCRLLPDTFYSYNAGGDPDAMSGLTHAQLRSFYETYYHPGNSYFFLYGDIPTDAHLEFLADKLETVSSNVTSVEFLPLRREATNQPRWQFPRTASETYPVGANEPVTEKTYLLLSWLIGDATDVEDTILCKVLSLILLGNNAAPLRKAIIESKLGKDLFDYRSLMVPGTNRTGPHSTFNIGLTGTEADRLPAFTNLVIDALSRIADEEIEEERIEAAFRQARYHFQEVKAKFPADIMSRVVQTWIYGKDPTTSLKTGSHLHAIHRRWKRRPTIFNDLIRKRLLENPHRLTTVLSPDPCMQERLDADLNQRLKAIRARLTDRQVRTIAEDAAELERLNSEPNSTEALETLPQLNIADLPPKPNRLPTQIERVRDNVLLRSDVFSNGVNYLVLNFDLNGLPQHLWAILPRYIDAISKLGAATQNFEKISKRIAMATGGLECVSEFSTHAGDADRPLWSVNFRLNALDDTIEDALDVLQDLLFALNPRDRKRLYDVLSQAVAANRRFMVHGSEWYGSRTAIYHAGRGLSPQAHLSEVVFGIPQLRTSEMLLNRFDEEHEDLMECIEEIRDFLLVRGRLTASFTGTDVGFDIFQERLAEWIGNMPEVPISPGPTGFKPLETPPREGLAAPVQVAYCTNMIPAPHYSHPDSTLLTIGAHIIQFDYILSEIRLKGNAYGAGFVYKPFDASLCQGSFADPHIARTLEIFAQTSDYVRQVDWSRADIDRAIIATAKEYVKPIRPSQATSDALRCHIAGETSELREDRYAQLRSATPREVKRALLEFLEEYQDEGAICVVASREKLEAENRKMKQPLAIEDILT
ncbi:MAG: insulinase family protein [Gemmatimonadota bacterium]|nr:insulinase family protein [Gemmatimonadota bacterium]